jgi:hypothetical protein
MPSSSYARIAIDDHDNVEPMEDIRIAKQQPQSMMMEAGIHIQTASTFEIDAGDDDDNDNYDDDDDDDDDYMDLEQQPHSHHGNNTQQHKKLHAPPSQYICPLTLQVMQDPVNDGCGHCFERDAIANWLDYHEMCPISRKPLRLADLRQAPGLQRNIEAWCQKHHNAQDINYDDNLSDTSTTSGSLFQSQLELMLLPQERIVLQIIKSRARDRRQRHEYAKCLWIIALVTATFLVVATFFSMKFLELELRGPI